MACDTSALPFAKPKPAALERKARKVIRESLDKAESDKVKARSGGRCEVFTQHPALTVKFAIRCQRRAVHIHHRLGGHGVRGRGKSALAEWKLHCCEKCHRDIHAHVLVPEGSIFRRVR